MWFRRDLRLGDNPALRRGRAPTGTCCRSSCSTRLWGPAGPSGAPTSPASLRALDAALRTAAGCRWSAATRSSGRAGRARVGADRVHVAADYGPYGAARDERVEQALAEHGIALVRTGSPYAVAPGRVTKGSGDAVPGVHAVLGPGPSTAGASPVDAADRRRLAEARRTPGIPDAGARRAALPEAGEEAARRRWQEFLDGASPTTTRAATGPAWPAPQMSVHLK